jgi:hypothetical protein
LGVHNLKKLSKRCFSSKQTLDIGEICSWSVFFAFYLSNLAIFNFCQQQSKESYIYLWVLSTIQNSNFLLVNDASFAIWNFSTASMLPWVSTAEHIEQQRRHLFIFFFFKNRWPLAITRLRGVYDY